MSEAFADNTPNNGYLKAASQLYGKVENVFEKREIPVTVEHTSGGARRLSLEGEELAFADDTFTTEGLGPVDSFRIWEGFEKHDLSNPDEVVEGSATILITVESGPVEYTYYIGKADGESVSMFDKEITKNLNYIDPSHSPEVAAALGIAHAEGVYLDDDEPVGLKKLFGAFEAADAGTDRLSLQDQRAIESVLDHLASEN